MKKYQSHKVVEAARIQHIDQGTDGFIVFTMNGKPGGEEHHVPQSIFARGKPPVNEREGCFDGYLVRYADGYVSWSPSKAFEEGYTPLPDEPPRAAWDKNAGATPLVQVPLDYEGNRVTPERLEALVVGEEYLRTDANTLTVCVLTLRNGFTVTGQSACADPANYDRELGESIALENAIKAIWPLEGYLLRELLWRQGNDRPETSDAARAT